MVKKKRPVYCDPDNVFPSVTIADISALHGVSEQCPYCSGTKLIRKNTMKRRICKTCGRSFVTKDARKRQYFPRSQIKTTHPYTYAQRRD